MAGDVVQDTFEKLWVKLEDVSGLKVKTYLFTAAYHTMMITSARNKDILKAILLPCMKVRNRGNIPISLRSWNGHYRICRRTRKAVVMLRDYEGYSYKEIAAITKLSEAQVKVYIYRARVYLKNYIGSMEQVI
jgi:DNA-directed RNA polymerase specialized sigma24 family protein